MNASAESPSASNAAISDKSHSTIFTKELSGKREIFLLFLRANARTAIFFETQFFIVATPSMDGAPVIAKVIRNSHFLIKINHAQFFQQ